MRLINIYEVSPDDIVAQNVYASNGTLLVKKGVPISIKVINNLNTHKIYSVYVTDAFTENLVKSLNLEEVFDLKDVIDPHMRRSFNQEIRKRFEIFKKTKGLGRYSSQGSRLLQGVEEISHKIVDELVLKNDPLVSLSDIKQLDIYDYQHSVNTAVLSVLTGLKLGMSEQDLNILAQGSLLMNIGNEFIIETVKKKKEKLTQDEFEVLKKHTEIGREILADQTILSGHVKNIVLNHHERMNGSGYPRGLKGKDIDVYSKIVMVADVYDAMTSDRPHRKAFSPNEALEYIMGATSIFDYDVTMAFSRNIIPYPVGEFVALSNGDVALVIGNNKSLPLRPVVRVITGIHINALIDLSENRQLVILRKVKNK